MAKGGKLTKLKSVLKKLNSFNSKQNRPCAISSMSSSNYDESSAVPGSNLHPVYVGKSRRRYLVSSDVVDHPLFRELVERSGHHHMDADNENSVTVACEVVLFEHLLWMLENADTHIESLDELVEFYAC